MSLTFNLKDLFTREYPNSSIEELEEFIAEAENDIEFLLEREKSFACSCHLSSHDILFQEYTDGRFRVEFSGLPFDYVCPTCDASINSNSASPIEDYHPRLMLELVNYTKRLFELAMYCKEQKYHELSNEHLEEKIKNTHDYSRYLRRCERHCDWDEVPPGFTDEQEKNTKEIEALEFEMKSRTLRCV